MLLDLVRFRRFDLLAGFDWNGGITYVHGPEKDDCSSRHVGGPRRALAHVDGVIYRLWALLLSWGVPCPARFAALREDPMWGALRAEQGALWGALAARADVPLSRQQRAERACQLLDENDGFRTA